MAGTIVIGTISLEDLCGCPDPCPACCSVPTDCCPAVNQTLTASWALTDCACAGASGEVTLTWQGVGMGGGNSWLGTGAFGSCPGHLRFLLSCPPTGPDCTGFLLDTDYISDSGLEDCASNSGLMPTSCNCDPFQIVFTITNVTFACCEQNPIITPSNMLVTIIF